MIDFHSGRRVLDIGAEIRKGMLVLVSAGFDVEGFEPSGTFREKAIEVMGQFK